MGYIKKLKNNELVGGTDKTTIYPVTSTEAVFEETTNGSESSFKSQKTINKEQQDELDDHEERIQAAEAEDIKSITINGSTKEFRVDGRNNVDLTIYTVDNDPEMPSIASNVEDLRNMVGTSTPVLGTSHKTRIETLEGDESVTGSVENKIKTKVDSINSSYQDDNNEYVKYSMTQTSGEVTDFNIDETSLKNAITSLSTSISGTNIIIVPQNQNLSSTGSAGTIYRKINAGNTYTDYMYSNGWKELATHDTSSEQSQVAYYTCTATGNGAQATKQFVSNGSLEYTPSNGGHIKILMGEANTATGTIYLQYNTDATNTKKPLYYNGEPVSASNTWDAGETIAVYYDPSANNNTGAYFASNAQGGGGKAEKIKYDNSQSGLLADNVQEALDEVGDTLFELSEKAIAMGTSTKYYYTYENGVIGTEAHNNFRLWQPVDISEFYALSIKFYLPASFAGKSFFTKEVEGEDVMVGDFLVNEEDVAKTYIVPEGATKLYFSVYYNGHTDISVKGIKRKGLDDKVEQLEEVLKDTNENTVLDKVTFYNPYSSTQYGYVKEDGTIATGSSSSPYRYTGYIEVEEDNVIYIHANFVVTAVAVLAAFDSEKTFIQGSNIMADGSGSQDIIYKVPAGVSYLRLSASTSDNTWKAEKGISVKNVLADGLHGVIEYTPEHGAGDAYLQLDGTYVADGNHNWKITYPFNVLEGDEVFFQTTNNTSTGMVGAYTDESLMVASSVVAGSDQNSKMWYKYTVPQGVKWIRISHKYSVDGDITVYIRRKIEKMPKKSISVLFIGNSITQDTVTYVPLLLRELAPELDFHFYIWYNGGFTLDQHLAYFNNDTPCSIFSRCSNSPSWKNFTDSVTMSSILSTYTFDIVQIQEYCHYKDTDELVDASVQTFNDIIEYIEDHYDKPFKVATLYHKTLLDHDNRATAPQVFERTRTIISRYLKDTVTELLNPAGISMYRAMAVPELDELGDQGHLSPDARHAQEGLPCMMEAYVTAMWLLNILGIPMSVVNSRTVVNNNNYEGIGVPGANLGTGVVIGTEEQVRLSQLVAVKALKEGEYIRNKELTEYTT